MTTNRPMTRTSSDPEPLFRRASLIGRSLAVSLVGVVAWKWILIPIVFRNPPWSPVGSVSILFLGLLVGSVAGLLKMRPWGFYCAYLLVPVSTMLLGIALVPFVTDWLPTRSLQVNSLFVLNVAFLVATAASHLMYRRSTRGDGGAAAAMRANA
jgi:hypothetical protein